MYNILLKHKQFFFIATKWVIVLLAFYFIYGKLTSNELLSIDQFQKQLRILFSNSIWLLLALLLFTDANLLLEVFKWQTLVAKEKSISFFEAFEQVFTSLTASIITPNRIGEYGAKAFFFEKKFRKKVLVLNLVGNLYQLIATFIFGLIGLIFYYQKLQFGINLKKPNKLFIIGLSVIVVGILFKLFNWNSLLQKVMNYWRSISTTKHLSVFMFSILRYLVFSHQFYFLLLLFGIDIEYKIAISFIFCMYLLASIIPSLNIFDWAIKGSIAVWLFSFEGVNELTIITITTIMWLLNFGVPALFGSVFVLNFKIEKV